MEGHSLKQKSLGFYGKGIYKTASGHLKYYSPKALRDQYVHRKVVEDLLKETHPLTLQLLSYPYEVHHADWNKENNDPSNFILLDCRFHSTLTVYGSHYRGRFEPRWKPAPDWALFKDDSGTVPF
jgi:hypothetical protein